MKINFKKLTSNKALFWCGVTVSVLGLATAVVLAQSGPRIVFEAESGTISGSASLHPDLNASDGNSLQFNHEQHPDQIPAAQLPKGNPIYAESRILLFSSYMPPHAADGTGNYRIVCEFSHMSYDDPIVYPGQQGAAHLHTFFGNTSADYTSTYSSLTAAGRKSTCPGGGANLSSYWFPTLMNGATPVVPSTLGVYYKSEYLPGSVMNDVPQGLKMVAGNKNSLVGQNPFIVFWACSGGGGSPGTVMPSCPAGQQLEMDVKFPQCWNGTSLDSANHISHLHYVGLDPQPPGTVGHYGDGCSKEVGFQVPIPEITIKVFWTVPAGGSANLRLSSDMPGAQPGASAHADYIEGWNRPILQRFMQHCIREARDTTNNLCDGEELVSPNQFQFH